MRNSSLATTAARATQGQGLKTACRAPPRRLAWWPLARHLARRNPVPEFLPRGPGEARRQRQCRPNSLGRTQQPAAASAQRSQKVRPKRRQTLRQNREAVGPGCPMRRKALAMRRTNGRQRLASSMARRDTLSKAPTPIFFCQHAKVKRRRLGLGETRSSPTSCCWPTSMMFTSSLGPTASASFLIGSLRLCGALRANPWNLRTCCWGGSCD